ncbi:MAG: peptidylprolyl isomerase [Calditrichia bacterium]
MMSKLREMTFVFIWILVIAFVALMVFEWGMDFTGMKGRATIVGEINGQKIHIQDFQKAIQNAYMQEKQRTGQEPDENRMAQLRDQVWESYIQRVLYAKEIERRGIKVTDREIFLQVMQNPPAEIRQNPSFQTDGKFDIAKYQQALRDPNVDLTSLENYYREILPYQKLQEIITSAVVVTEEEVRNAYMEENIKAKIKYLMVPITSFTKDSVSVTEDEIKEYYNKHKEEFSVEEKRKLDYVIFSTNPSAEDTAKVRRLAEEVLKEAKSGVDFAQLADEYSEDPSVTRNHGDLGFFEKGRMVKPFEEAAFNAKPGEIVGPVETNFGLHIIKVHERKVENKQPKVHASHILLRYNASALTLEQARNAADNFAEVASEEGFKKAADQFKYEIKQTPEFPKRPYIPGLGNLASAIEWVFKAKVDDVSKVHRTNQGYVVFRLAEIMEAGYRPFEEVKGICKNRVMQEKRKVLVRDFAKKIEAELQKGKTFEELKNFDPARTLVVDSTAEFSMSQPIPKIGKMPKISAAAFSLPLQKVSPLLETNRGAFFIIVTHRTPFDEKEYAAKRNALRRKLLSTKQNQFFTNWYEQLKENADIEDNRDQFFAS